MAPRSLVARQRAQRNGKQRAQRMAEWARYVKREPCAMCRDEPPTPEERRDFHFEIDNLQAHHIHPQHDLKNLARRMGWDADKLVDILTDSRNGMCLCEFHHARHTRHYVDKAGRSWRVPRRLLRDETYDFAAELHIEWLLDREYPDA